MLVQALLFVVLISAQFGPPVPNESRAPMAIRPPATKNCNLAIGGEAWVGRVSAKGGAIEVRDLTGAGVLAATGTLKFQFANGRYFESMWRYSAPGTPARSFKITPEDSLFPGGLVAPIRIDATVLGVYFAGGEICGESGSKMKDKFQQHMESFRMDAAQVTQAANTMSPKQFEAAIQKGLLDTGPYQRPSALSSNTQLKSRLIGADGKLIPNYKEWLRRWQDSLKPAKSAPQTRLSRQPAQ